MAFPLSTIEIHPYARFALRECPADRSYRMGPFRMDLLWLLSRRETTFDWGAYVEATLDACLDQTYRRFLRVT